MHAIKRTLLAQYSFSLLMGWIGIVPRRIRHRSAVRTFRHITHASDQKTANYVMSKGTTNFYRPSGRDT
jgi:hypothetical protein